MLRKLLKHLTLCIQGTPVITGSRRPLGYVQVTLDATTAVGFTLPTPPAGFTCNFCLVQNEDSTNAVRWRDDGTVPTTAIGMKIAAGGELQYAGDVAALRFIGAAGTPKINISVYA